MFTVIIAVKDCELWLPRTLNSLVSQTFSDWECLISVNGTNEKTLKIAKSIRDSRFTVISSPVANKSLAINRALVKASKEWICILDADDLWRKDKLEMQYKELHSSTKVDILGTQLVYIDENDLPSGDSPKLPLHHHEIVEWLTSNNNSIANSSVCYRKKLHDIVGYYDPEMFGVEDYDMWKRCARSNLVFSNLKEDLLLHRIHRNSSYNSGLRQKRMKVLVDSVDQAHKQIRSET